MTILEGLTAVRAKIVVACESCGRDPSTVSLLPVSKRHPPAAILQAKATGLSLFGENRVQELSEITRQLKALARDLNVPVIALSQLSRSIEQRPDHYPQLSDLRESGSIEQDADVVAFIHREDKYYTEDQWAERYPTEQYPENLAKLIIAKNRHGPTSTIHLYFRGNFMRFENLATEYSGV